MEDNGLVGLLLAGEAFIDLSYWRKTSVSGVDRLRWLDALVSAGLDDLVPGRARAALLLSPTGRIRAEFTVATRDQDLLLIQDPGQPRPIQELLTPYVLSADVSLADRTSEVGLFAFPGRADPPDVPGTTLSVPSCLGRGVDLLCPSEQGERVLEELSKKATQAGGEALETWCVLSGRPRLGVDALEDDLPQEGGLIAAVSFDKGCFPGQEAVAKVRNLGHPRRLLLRVEADQPLSPGDVIHVGGSEAGEVTSVARAGKTTVALARVRWDVTEGPFQTAAGAHLRVRPTA